MLLLFLPENLPFYVRFLYNIFMQGLGVYSSFVASVSGVVTPERGFSVIIAPSIVGS